MKQRTLVKIYELENCFCVKTISRSFRSPDLFYISKERLSGHDWNNCLILNDGHSYAELRRWQQYGLDILQINFVWLCNVGNGVLKGQQQAIKLPFEVFEDGGGENRAMKLLAIEDRLPQLVFRSRKNLRQVSERRVLRRKLVGFLNRHFAWPGYERIEITDDFSAYSFFFTGYTAYGTGTCGGIILHGQENMKKAYYGIHT